MATSEIQVYSEETEVPEATKIPRVFLEDVLKNIKHLTPAEEDISPKVLPNILNYLQQLVIWENYGEIQRGALFYYLKKEQRLWSSTSDGQHYTTFEEFCKHYETIAEMIDYAKIAQSILVYKLAVEMHKAGLTINSILTRTLTPTHVFRIQKSLKAYGREVAHLCDDPHIKEEEKEKAIEEKQAKVEKYIEDVVRQTPEILQAAVAQERTPSASPPPVFVKTKIAFLENGYCSISTVVRPTAYAIQAVLTGKAHTKYELVGDEEKSFTLEELQVALDASGKLQPEIDL